MASEYENGIIPLSLGLDLRSNRLLGQPGSLRNCLNREVIDSIGLKRIDGFEPYDGKATPAITDFFYIDNLNSWAGDLDVEFPANSLLTIYLGSDVPFGKVLATETLDDFPSVGQTTSRIYYSRLNRDLEPTTSDSVPGTINQFEVTTAPTAGTTLGDAPTSVVSISEHAATLRSDIGDLPDTPIGLHWFRDRLYSVVTDSALHFTSGGTTEPLANYYIRGATSGTIARILNVQLGTGTWAGGDAAGLIEYRIVSGTGFTGTEVIQYSNDVAFGSTLSADICNRSSGGTLTSDYASLWQSRTERQAVEESADPGWEWIDHGFTFNYTDGTSDIGRFTKVEKSSDNNFTYDEDDDYGESVEVYNGSHVVGSEFSPGTWPIVISTARVDEGYPGWKTSASLVAWATDDELNTAVQEAAGAAYANLYYQGGVQSQLPFGASGGYLLAEDKTILGPSGTAPATVGTETFATDFLSGQARAPMIFKDLSAVTASIPEGSLITGVEVEVSYGSQHYAEGSFQADRNGTNGADISVNTVNWVKDAIAWEAAFVTVDSATQSTLLGTAQRDPILILDGASMQEAIAAGATEDTFRIAGSLTSQTATIGSSTNAFGLDNFSRSDLLDTQMGLALYGQFTASPFYPLTGGLIQHNTSLYENVYGSIRLTVDRVRIRFYYTTPSARYYARSSGTEICSVDLVYFVNSDGSLTAGTGEGEWQVTNVQTVDGTKRSVETGDTVHVSEADAITGANPILTAADNMIYNGLPSITRINTANSRYQFISANFYAREDWDGIYGASGADRGFSFSAFDADGAGGTEPYFISISTNTADRDEDKPRHVVYHHGSLIFGFSGGKVACSVSGLPENFSGEDGAAELGVGDHLTGLLSLPGETLAVYCEGSIHSFLGADPLTFQPRTISPRTGAIEYTPVNIGIPVHCDSRGVTTLEQSDKYGDFVGERLSSAITPWIAKRMLMSDTLFSTENGNGIVCAVPVRTNNQLRLFFKDGYVLCMTINPGAPPAFTYLRYFLDQEGATADDLLDATQSQKFLVPIASSSEIDHYGQEKIHISHFSNLSTVSSNFVYELNSGWGFAGKYIPEFYTVDFIYRDPFTNNNVKHVAIDGLTTGVGSSLINTAEDYQTDSNGEVLFNTTSVDISLPRVPFARLRQDPLPVSRNVAVAARGRAIAFKVKGAYLSGEGVDVPVPSDIHQVLLMQYPIGGAPFV